MSVRGSISEQRFHPYLVAAGYDEAKALAIYLWNIKLCEATYPAMHMVEVALRNHVLQAVGAAYGATWWHHPDLRAALGAGQARLSEALTKAQRTASGKRRALVEGDVVSELTFGFWVRMLDRRYKPRVWTAHFHATFPHVPPSVGREGLKARLLEVVDLRNRVFHHEPIIARNVLREHERLIGAIEWIDPDAAAWIKPHSRLPEVVHQRP